jgi:O-acetylserine/cysteine efflux transporter
MPFRSIVLGVIGATLWGLSFIASAVALEALSPPQLTALRFIIAAVPVLVLPRPPVPWIQLVAIGLTLFAGQFLLFFLALAMGLPPGLASVTQQTQVLFSTGLAAVFLGDMPRRRSVAGMLIAFVGLLLIALSVGRSGPIAALAVGIAAALSWAIGNVLIKRLGPVPVVPLMAWLSLVPPVPALAISYFSQGPGLFRAIAAAGWSRLAAVLYLGMAATTIAYGIWGRLLTTYPTSTVAPFTLLVPIVGVAASALMLGERFTALRAYGMVLMLAGVAVAIISPRTWAGTGTTNLEPGTANLAPNLNTNRES